MNSLVRVIEDLKETEISEYIQERINEFSSIKEKGILEIFKELCFCIMTANCGAEKCIEIHEKIGNHFMTLTEENLVKKFKEYGYRFPNKRANYIVNARDLRMELEIKLKNNIDEFELREWLVKNIKGLGYKEGSHFLRNIGCKNVAIIDFHIIDVLAKHNLIAKPKYLNRNRYLEIENFLKNIGKKLHLSLAELDLYLWYLETGKVLK